MSPSGRLGTTHFRLAKQRAMIQGHGEHVLVFPVLQCPCLLADRQFNPICPTCHGTGRLYPPGTAYSTTLLLVHEHSSRTYNEPGTWIPGTLQASILPGVRLSERDKVRRVMCRESFVDEVLTRGLDETVRFPAGVQLEVIADRERVYQAGRDYVLQPPNQVQWVAGGQAPAFGSQYSVKYAAHPEYLVTPDQPKSRLEHGTGQSQVVILTRLDYLQEGV